MAQINFQGVSIKNGENEILRNVSFEIAQGEFVYLVGKTGSGKSSLLKSMYGELKLNDGNACLGDFNLIKLKKRKVLELRRSIGIVFQDFQLLSDRSVYDNLKFVLKATGWKKKSEIDNRIDEVLGMVGMSEKSKKFPHQVSGGEQQRIAIARALLNNPEIILADEPTGNLDPETTNDIMQLLNGINSQGKTIIMASHDYEMIKAFPQRTLRCVDLNVFEVNLSEDIIFN